MQKWQQQQTQQQAHPSQNAYLNLKKIKIVEKRIIMYAHRKHRVTNTDKIY